MSYDSYEWDRTHDLQAGADVSILYFVELDFSVTFLLPEINISFHNTLHNIIQLDMYA
jgi:hypothetical protein